MGSNYPGRMSNTEEIVQGVIEGLQAKGLVLVPESLALEALELKKAKMRLMQRKYLTPYEVSKFKLIGSVTANTIKNMVKDGRIMDHEHFTDEAGKLYITREGIKRLNNYESI